MQTGLAGLLEQIGRPAGNQRQASFFDAVVCTQGFPVGLAVVRTLVSLMPPTASSNMHHQNDKVHVRVEEDAVGIAAKSFKNKFCAGLL